MFRWHRACTLEVRMSSANRHASTARGAHFDSRRTDDNPSGWSKRARLLVLAAAGLAIACYLTSYQVGMVSGVWDPLFGAGSDRVLRSALSRRLPVPDALLGALGYVADLVLTSIGGRDRARTHPRIVLLLGATVTMMAVASAILVFLQVVVLRSFCTLCLGSAGLSMAIFALAWDEVAASLAGPGTPA